jgi:hypothetical protein
MHRTRQRLHDVDVNGDVAVALVGHADFQHVVDLV